MDMAGVIVGVLVGVIVGVLVVVIVGVIVENNFQKFLTWIWLGS